MRLLAQLSTPVAIGDTFLGTGANPLKESTGLSSIVSLVVKLGFVVSGILILFFIILAGFSVISGAGNNNPEAAKRGQQAATAALIGFVVVFAAYWIVRLIEVMANIHIIS